MASLSLLSAAIALCCAACTSSTGQARDGAVDQDARPTDASLADGATADSSLPHDGAAALDAETADGEADAAHLLDATPGPDAQATEVCNGVDDDGDGLVDEGLEAFCGACGRPYDTAVTSPYPIQATWMYGRNACEWQDALEAFHRQGGESVWQFGPSFEVHTAAEIRADQDFAACTQGGTHCVDSALADLTAANPANHVANWLTYHFGDNYSNAILACPSLDRKIIVGNRTYWRVVLPHSASQTPCDFSGGTFDVLFTWHEGPDTKAPLLRAADGLGMQVLLGMPAAPPVENQTWNVSTALRPAFLEWSRRVLADYAQRHAPASPVCTRPLRRPS